MLTFTTLRLRDLFYAAGLQPTPTLLDLALPDVLVEGAKRYFARSFGPAFKAPPPSGAESPHKRAFSCPVGTKKVAGN